MITLEFEPNTVTEEIMIRGKAVGYDNGDIVIVNEEGDSIVELSQLDVVELLARIFELEIME